jgi:hypothetical protein
MLELYLRVNNYKRGSRTKFMVIFGNFYIGTVSSTTVNYAVKWIAGRRITK